MSSLPGNQRPFGSTSRTPSTRSRIYATADRSARAGADYTATSGTLAFLPGERSKTVQVAILDDAHDEGEKTFTLALPNARAGSPVRSCGPAWSAL